MLSTHVYDSRRARKIAHFVHNLRKFGGRLCARTNSVNVLQLSGHRVVYINYDNDINAVPPLSFGFLGNASLVTLHFIRRIEIVVSFGHVRELSNTLSVSVILFVYHSLCSLSSYCPYSLRPVSFVYFPIHSTFSTSPRNIVS